MGFGYRSARKAMYRFRQMGKAMYRFRQMGQARLCTRKSAEPRASQKSGQDPVQCDRSRCVSVAPALEVDARQRWAEREQGKQAQPACLVRDASEVCGLHKRRRESCCGIVAAKLASLEGHWLLRPAGAREGCSDAMGGARARQASGARTLSTLCELLCGAAMNISFTQEV